MTAFAILTGKSLKNAIKGFSKVASTFSERTHQLAYSALNHVEQHHDAIYCQAIYDATPKNYRLAVQRWFVAFGKVAFDAKAGTFSYAKGKKSDLPTALVTSPADYEKAKGSRETASASLMERIGKLLTKAIEDENASREDKAFARAMTNSLELYKRSLEKAPAGEAAAPKANKPKVAKGKAKADAAAETPTPVTAETGEGEAQVSTIKRVAVDPAAMMEPADRFAA